MHIFVVSM